MAAKRRLRQGETTAIKLWKNYPVLTTGVLGVLLLPRILDGRRRTQPLHPARRAAQQVFTWNTHAKYILPGQFWTLVETSKAVRILRTGENSALPNDQGEALIFKQSGKLAKPAYIRLTRDVTLIYDDHQDKQNLSLLDFSQEDSKKLIIWKKDFKTVDSYHASPILVSSITRKGASRAGEPSGISHEKIMLTSTKIDSKAKGGANTDVKKLLGKYENEFLESAVTAKSTLTTQLFVTGSRTAALFQLKCSDGSTKFCLFVLRPSQNFKEHLAIGNTNFSFEAEKKVPRCTFFARSQIHALFLGHDTSGLLLKHTGSHIEVVGRWNELSRLIRLWNSPSQRRLRYCWNASRKSIMVVNLKHVDAQNHGRTNFFELQL